MAFYITPSAQARADKINITPNLVLEIDGIDTIYGLVPIQKYILIGDPDLLIGPAWVIGGLNDVADQSANITFDGTSTTINQKLDPDKAAGTTISTFSIALLNTDGTLPELVSAGFDVPDILARKCVVSLGFNQTAWPQDYIKIFRGNIDQVVYGPSKATFNLSHPDQKKRQDIFVKADTLLNGAITNSSTTITVDSTTNFFSRVLGPDGIYDPSINYGIKIEDEIIFFTGKTGTTFTGCLRGQLGTGAVSHADNAQVDSYYEITGNGIDLALKLMFSSWQGPWVSNIDIKNIGLLADLTPVDNSIFFADEDIYSNYGIVVGDWVTISGSAFGANNITRQVTEINNDLTGSYLVVDGAALTAEGNSPAVIAFRSQYDTFANGLKLTGDEVDTIEHLRIQRLFLSSYDLDFYLKDTINGKTFIEEQIYFPGAAYSVPRKSQISIGFHIGPIPGTNPKIFNDTNTKKPAQLMISRNINKNFYNTIIYKYDELPLEEKYVRGYITQDAQSLTDIPIGTKALIIRSNGMRELEGGLNIATLAASRRLKRYKRGAEYIQGFETLYGESFNIEIGDICVVEGSSLKMLDTVTATYSGDPKLYEVINKTFDIKTGNVKLDLINTNYSANSRYFLMSPSSRILTAASSTVFKLRKTGNSVFGNNEGAKWSRYLGASVRVCSDDFTTRNGTSTILSVLGNTITLSSSLGFTPLAEDKMILTDYNSTSTLLHLIYGWMTDAATFDDGTQKYQMIG